MKFKRVSGDSSPLTPLLRVHGHMKNKIILGTYNSLQCTLILEAPCLCLLLLFFVPLPPFLTLYYAARAVNPPRLQILRIDREGMIDDEILHGTLVHLSKKYS